MLSDTSYEGYEEIPRDVMQGYGTVAAEIVEALPALAGPGTPIKHVFLQGGVGGLAAGIVSYFWEVYGGKRPAVVIVEPRQADCLYQSAVQGIAAKTTGSVDSVMAKERSSTVKQAATPDDFTRAQHDKHEHRYWNS